MHTGKTKEKKLLQRRFKMDAIALIHMKRCIYINIHDIN